MGSMTKVMQKIQEAEAAPAPSAPETEAVTSAPPPGAEEAVSSFVPGEAAPDTAVAPNDGRCGAQPLQGDAAGAERNAGPDDGRTVTWDPQRVDPVIVAFHDRYSAVCEQYRGVRARLLTMNPARAPQILAITSAIPEEGKSVSTVNLGLVMAEGNEHRILIADADFRRTSIARMLGVSDTPGLADVLTGAVPLATALQPTPLPNLKLLPAGRVRDNAYAELLGGPSTGQVLSELRQQFDYVFLDTPPITTVSDVCLLAPRCDGALVVVQMRRTPEPTVQQAVRTLQANNVKIVGAILSRFRERGSAYYEHYYSYYYR